MIQQVVATMAREVEEPNFTFFKISFKFSHIWLVATTLENTVLELKATAEIDTVLQHYTWVRTKFH